MKSRAAGADELFILLAPAVCNRIGDRNAMLVGSCCYALYTASLMLGNQLGARGDKHPALVRASVLGASVLIGFGAAVLWVGQGSYITECCAARPADRGRQAGEWTAAWHCHLPHSHQGVSRMAFTGMVGVARLPE